jgi:hypothetical protein
VDSISYPDALELVDYWSDNPPTHILLKSFMGYEGKSKATPTIPDEQELKNIVGVFNGGR